MKRKFYYYLVLLIGAIIYIFPACTDMDDTYKQFVVPGGITYPGKANNLVAHSGINRVKLTWSRGTDPKVVKARIYWNNYTDSVEVVVPESTSEISYMIENLPENTYSFYVKTFDEKGNSSIPVEAIGSSYGDKYKKNLLNIVVNSTRINKFDSLSIIWGVADLTNGAIATQVRYKNSKGNTIIKQMPIATEITNLKDFAGSTFEYRTLFLPNAYAIDTCFSEFLAYNDYTLIVKKDLAVTTDSYEPVGQLPNGAPELILDDNLETYWHSEHKAKQPKYPHWLAFDMQREVTIRKVILTARTSNYSNNFTEFIVQKSTNGTDWVNCQTYAFAAGTGAQTFLLTTPPTARYIRIYMTKGTGTVAYAHLAEIAFYGY